MAPPTIPEPEVVLPKPVPEKPKEQVAEKPKEKPKDKPKEKPKEPPKDKPKEQAKEKPKPETKPDPEAEPAPAQNAPPQPSQQAAVAAAPLQQAAVPAAPSAADLARIADAKTNWQGLLFAHLEKYRKYPKSAKRRNEEGVAGVYVRMDRLGNVLSYKLTSSSGYEALDEEAVALIKRAEPLPALPAEIPNDIMEISLPLQFFLK